MLANIAAKARMGTTLAFPSALRAHQANTRCALVRKRLRTVATAVSLRTIRSRGMVICAFPVRLREIQDQQSAMAAVQERTATNLVTV